MTSAECAWVLWTRGRRGPEAAVIRYRGNPPLLSEIERKSRLAEAIRFDPDDALLPLRAIERLYPLPETKTL